jgi:uncharacterized protein (TIGR04222 family)
MNPFDLTGPDFLLFYMVLSVGLIGGAHVLRRRLESGSFPRLGEPDPYLIAYLRGGPHEAIRVATISLLDRGLLKAEGNILMAAPDAVLRVRRPLERAILDEFGVAPKASNILFNPVPYRECETLGTELQRLGLLPSSKQVLARVFLGLAVTAILWWVAFTKISIANARGHDNTGFLKLLTVVVLFAVIKVLWSRKTLLGVRMLEDLQTLFDRLRFRANEIPAGGATNELALVVGIYGLTALSGAAFIQAQDMFPSSFRPARNSASTSNAASCGSSSCGGGGGCGGGGCGGGGCGGCGS